MSRYRYHPTAARAAELRAELASVGAKATVSVQRWALRIIARTDGDRMLSMFAASQAGFEGPTGGDFVRNNDCFFAYDFRGEAA